MNKLLVLIIAVAFLSVNSAVYSSKNESGSQGTNQEEQQIIVPTGNQVQNQNQVETQNKGEESQLNVNTQEQESLGENQDEKEGSGSARSKVAMENISIVSENVEKLLMDDTSENGIGKEVRQIAQDQKQAQGQIKTDLEKVDKRGGLLKSLIGPDYQALKNMQKQMEQNQLRIQQLEKLMTQLSNQNDITMVQETIQVLTDQNTALQDKVVLEEKMASLFGWFFKLFAR